MALNESQVAAFLDSTAKAAKIIKETVEEDGLIHVFSHLDADGVAAAGIIGRALTRLDARFRVRITQWIEEKIMEVLADKPDLIVFSDLGSGYVDLLKEKLGEFKAQTFKANAGEPFVDPVPEPHAGLTEPPAQVDGDSAHLCGEIHQAEVIILQLAADLLQFFIQLGQVVGYRHVLLAGLLRRNRRSNEAALKYAVQFAKDYKAVLHVIHVVDEAYQYWMSMAPSTIPVGAPVVDDMVDTLRDANPEMSRQEARSIANSSVEEAQKNKKSPDEIFLSKWDGEEQVAKPFRNAMTNRVNTFWKQRGYQLTPIQAQEQGQAAPASENKLKPPAPAGKPSMSIASQNPVNPSRAKDTTDRDRQVAQTAENFTDQLDGKS
jgi:hypothetical protein